MTPQDYQTTKNSGKSVVVFLGFLFLGVFLLLTLLSVFSYKYLLDKYPSDAGSKKVDIAAAIEDFFEYISDAPPASNSNSIIINNKPVISDTKPTSTTSSSSNSSVKVEINNNQPPKVQIQVPTVPTPAPAPVAPTCYRYKIYEGEFESDKCYTQQDYKDLRYYIDAYNDAVWDKESAQNVIDVTCDSDWEPFVEDCEEAKDKKSDAKEKIEEYSNKIKNLIAKGW